jgi:hypothetical protein
MRLTCHQVQVNQMIKPHKKGRPNRARSLGLDRLEGRALLHGGGAAHASAAVPVESASEVAAEQALLPPTLEESYCILNGNSITGLVMIFSKPLDPTTATNLNNYQVIDALPTNDGISSAVYNPSLNSVTLTLAQPFPVLPTTNYDVLSVDVTTEAWLNEASSKAPTAASTSSITDPSGQPLVLDAYVLANFNPQGPMPNPLFNTYVQSQINEDLSRIAPIADEAAFNQANPIHLTGTIHGSYSTYNEWAPGGEGLPNSATPATVTKGTGSISPLGHVTDSVNSSPFFRGDLHRAFHTKEGTVMVSLNDARRTGTDTLEATFTIEGGTGQCAGEAGSGNVLIKWTGSSTRGKFTEIYS